MLFFIPFAGLAIGAGLGALMGHMGKNAIDKTFQDQVRDQVKPGTSALFMIIEQATPDKAIAALDSNLAMFCRCLGSISYCFGSEKFYYVVDCKNWINRLR